MRAPIVSRKHIIQHTITQVPTGTVANLIEARGEHVQDVNANFEVIEGSVIKAVYLEFWVIGTFNLGSFVVMVEKSSADNPSPSFTEMSLLDSYSNKKNILYTTQGLMAEDNQNPTPVLRQWLKIPKGKQRFGLDDRLRVNLASLSGEDLQFCGFTLYKSYQ